MRFELKRGRRMQGFRLTNEPGGLGLSCTSAGVTLAGVPLLQKTEAGFRPRPTSEIAALMKAAYSVDPTRLQSSLGLIAQALNRGNLARASIAAVLTRTPELSWEAAARLANAEERLRKYNPDEPRDWHGRWTTGGAAGPTSTAGTANAGAASEGANRADPHFSNPEQNVADGNGLLRPAAFRVPDDQADAGSGEPASLTQEFERKYDDLGPVDFAKAVTEFGSWLEREGKNLSPAERARALAEYAFLQDRLSFWLGYDDKPIASHGNLISAALTLYQGAVNGGFIRPGQLPASMLDVAGTAWAVDSLKPAVRPSIKPTFEDGPAAALEAPKEIEGLGGTVSNEQIGIVWNKGIKEQGRPWETYVGEENPNARALAPTATTFDHYDEFSGEAISAKTLNTLSVTYIKNPQEIYGKLSGYIDAAADYRPRFDWEVNPEIIRSKTIQLAVPEYTSEAQWQYLNMAIRYGRERGVSVVITRIRE